MEGLVGVVGRNDLCTGTKDQLCSVLQEEGHADCRDQQGDTGCVAQRGVGDLLDHNAQQRTGDDGGAHSSDRAKAQLIHHEPGHVRTNHNDIAMGKVQQQDDAVHHAVTQCDQCIDAAKGQAVDQLTKEHCHWMDTSFLSTKKAETTCSGGLRKGTSFSGSGIQAAHRCAAQKRDQNISFSSGLPST